MNAGSSSGTFNVSTLAVGASTGGNIVGIYNGVNAAAPLTVTAGEQLAVASVTLNPPGVVGGSVSTGTITLNGLAPSGGQPVTLSSDSSSATVPSPVWVNEGSTTTTFTINTSAVTGTTNANISATFNLTQTAVLAIAPSYGVASVTVNPGTVLGGANSTGTVTMTAPRALRRDGRVALIEQQCGGDFTFPNITVSAGSLTATFHGDYQYRDVRPIRTSRSPRPMQGRARLQGFLITSGLLLSLTPHKQYYRRKSANRHCYADNRRADRWDSGISLKRQFDGKCTANRHGYRGQYYGHVCSEHDRGDQRRDGNHRCDIQRRQPKQQP